MAGHSKWANIQHRKGRQDAARSKLFSKLSREITVAAKMGDPDPEKNPRLGLAVEEAKSNSVPKDVIERAIKKSMAGEGDEYEEIRYEGYGPNGVAVIVEAMTDNRNRTASNVRSIFSKHGGNLGETGSVGFMFERKGEILYRPEAGDADTIMMAAIEAGAEDIEVNEDDSVNITSSPEDFEAIKVSLKENGIEISDSEISLVPETTIQADLETSLKVYKLLEMLEDLDDTQSVTSNIEFAEGMIDELD